MFRLCFPSVVISECLLTAGLSLAAVAVPPEAVVHRDLDQVTRVETGMVPAAGGTDYEAFGVWQAESSVPGALVNFWAEELDGNGRVIKTSEGNVNWEEVNAVGFPRKVKIAFRSQSETKQVRLGFVAGGNPVSFRPLSWELKPKDRSPRFGGIYDPEDPPPADRAAALEEMARIPPATATIENRGGRSVAIIDGEPMPFNQYKGFTDYRLMGECGANLVLTFNRGSRLFRPASFDRADRDPATGEYDFSAIEDTLLRIHHANPKARVVIGLDLDPDKAFMERHPDSIFCDERGRRGVSNFMAFAGYTDRPIDPANVHTNYCFSYTSKEWRRYTASALIKLCEYLRQTPAANIVVGFHLAGGMDGQFVQWEYGPVNGHFDYSEANRRSLCRYLAGIYGSDAELQAAWGDPEVTLETARNPSVAEFRANPVLDDRPGLGRRIADCRRFVSVGPARTLNGFAKLLRREFGRPCLVDTWYTSTIWSQAGRLAIDELTAGDGVNVIVTVSNYSTRRSLDGVGASADNAIAGLNLRNLLFVQEMDHRSWRTQITGGFMSESTAIPKNRYEFDQQIRRDAASVIACGGAGFHFFDMFGSWYHGDEVKDVLREVCRLNRFATKYAGRYARPRLAIFGDEQARLLRESTFDAIDTVWRTSGVMPAIHYLGDIENPALPEYDAYVVWSAATLTRAQLEAFRRRASKKGKLLMFMGEVGVCSRDFAGTADVLGTFGVKVESSPNPIADYVLPTGKSPLLAGVEGAIEHAGSRIVNGRFIRRVQQGHSTVTGSSVKVLGSWKQSGGAAFVSKPMGEGTLLYMARDGGLTPRLVHNLAEFAGIRPFSEPGNAVYVGNGVACVHRLQGPARVEFPEPVRIVDFASERVSEPTKVWEPELRVGESAAIAYLP